MPRATISKDSSSLLKRIGEGGRAGIGVWNGNPVLQPLKEYDLVENCGRGQYRLTQKGQEWNRSVIEVPALTKAPTKERMHRTRSVQPKDSSLKEEVFTLLTELEKIIRALQLLTIVK
jgi:hypothetical protein